MFDALPPKPDHDALELAILERWEREGTFGRLRAQNADGPRFSFIDGPVTANKSLAVHTAWGRTLKDVFQRYKALQGYHQRYQNGFDCQGLWIEVGVEKELGLNSKREIEEYGLEAFAQRCRAVVERSAAELTAGSIRLGQWMDWGNDYFTFSDTNIEYIWRFLRIVHDRGWLFRGHRPRSGARGAARRSRPTSWSAATSTASTRPCRCASRSSTARARPSSSGPPRRGRCRPTWPWPCIPTARYGRLANGDWIGVERGGDATVRGDAPRAASSSAGATRAPSTTSAPAAEVAHRVIGWDEVSLDEGTGLVHIAPGCGTEDFELSKVEDLPVLMPVDESGRFVPAYGWLAGRAAHDVAGEVIADLRSRDLLVEAAEITHRYPECWRCHTPLIFRISDDWFISVDEIRAPMREANATVEWTPEYMGKRMDDWLVNMCRLEHLAAPLLRPAAAVLPVLVRPPQGRRLARPSWPDWPPAPLDDLAELRRPWIDRVAIRCPECGEEVQRIAEVGDVWLDAGHRARSPPSGGRTPSGSTRATPPARPRASPPPTSRTTPTGTSGSRPTGCRRCASRSGSGSTPSCSCRSRSRAGRRTARCSATRRCSTSTGQEMHGSWGNMIDAPEAFARMGADVMRWQYSAQPPTQNLLFGFGPGFEIQRKLLTLWNSVELLHPVRQHRRVQPRPAPSWRPGPSGDLEHLDRWLVERTRCWWPTPPTPTSSTCRSTCCAPSSSTWTTCPTGTCAGPAAGSGTATRPRCAPCGPRSSMPFGWSRPVMPFLTEHLWHHLVAGPLPDAPASIFLAGWPTVHPVDHDLLDDEAAVRQVVELGRQARAASKLKTRQPLRRLVVEGADRAARHADGHRRGAAHQGGHLRARSRPPTSGCGPTSPCSARASARSSAAVRRRSRPASSSSSTAVASAWPATSSTPTTSSSSARRSPGWAVASNDGVSVALDTELDDELRREGRVYDLIHQVNTMRKDAGLELTDRIRVSLPTSDDDLLDHAGLDRHRDARGRRGAVPDDELHIERSLTEELWFEGGMGILPHPFGGSGLREGRQHTHMAPTKKASAQKAPAKKAVVAKKAAPAKKASARLQRRPGRPRRPRWPRPPPRSRRRPRPRPSRPPPPRRRRPRRPRPGS